MLRQKQNTAAEHSSCYIISQQFWEKQKKTAAPALLICADWFF
ncbi:hypothetical protein SOVF_051740 [Spinacia oleracea]|nr:hypothetical protein SOVF_051740 [Spinacia oleracea]